MIICIKSARLKSMNLSMILLGVALSLLVIGLIRGLEISVWLILIASSLLYAGHLLGLIDKDPMAIILISIKIAFIISPSLL